MDVETIERFRKALVKFCWDNNFCTFREKTGFVGEYAHEKYHHLQILNNAINRFDSTTLADILNADQIPSRD